MRPGTTDAPRHRFPLAKEFLSQKGVQFESKNVAEDPAAGAELQARTGRTSVPVILVGDEVVVGFDRGRLQRLLRDLVGPAVRCPDCGALIELPPGVQPGDLVECPNCAGHALRVRLDDGRWSATLAHRVSCPDCDEVITLPPDAKSGDSISCCGRRYPLSFEYGAFAAETM